MVLKNTTGVHAPMIWIKQVGGIHTLPRYYIRLSIPKQKYRILAPIGLDTEYRLCSSTLIIVRQQKDCSFARLQVTSKKLNYEFEKMFFLFGKMTKRDLEGTHVMVRSYSITRRSIPLCLYIYIGESSRRTGSR